MNITSTSAALDTAIDANSAARIATLLEPVQPLARALVTHCRVSGLNMRVISALRTYDEQTALFAQGRTRPGRIVTNAPAGWSNHNFGLAFDLGAFDDQGRYLDDQVGTLISATLLSRQYSAAAVIGKQLGLTWGGDWQSIDDEPHFELQPDWASELDEHAFVAELRRRHASDQPVFG